MSIGPLHTLKLGPAGAQEGKRAITPRARRGSAASGTLEGGALLHLLLAPSGGGPGAKRSRRRRLSRLSVGQLGLIDDALAVIQPGKLVARLALRPSATHQRRIELVDLAGVLQRPGQVLPPWRRIRRRRRLAHPALLTLARALSITSHDASRPSASPGGWCAGGTSGSICAA
jgi:hypothetical protein